MRLALLLTVLTAPAIADNPSYPAKACVQLGGCSGTVIAIVGNRAYGLSAGHCATMGATVTMKNIDGSTGKARFVGVDREVDLALFVCWAKDVRGTAPVTIKVPDSKPVGHSRHGRFIVTMGAKGPIVETGTKKVMVRRDFLLKDGKFDDGSSGGGIFADGRLCWVATHGDEDDNVCAVPHTDIVSFLSRFRKRCGPLVSVDAPTDEAPKLPADWGDRDRTKEILSLKQRMAALERKLDGLSLAPGPAGPAGPPGQSGAPGKTPDISDTLNRLDRLEKWRSAFKARVVIRLTPRETTDGNQP